MCESGLGDRNVSPARTTDRYQLLEVAEWLYEKREELKELVGKVRSIREGVRSGMALGMM